MENYAWVCFSCRTATRRSPRAKDVRCRGCAKPCECIGYTPVPSKLKVREWDALFEAIHSSRRAHLFGEQKRRVRRIHDLEREIVLLESMPANEGRADSVKKLRERLERLRA